MSRITKTDAHKIAEQLSTKKLKIANDLKAEYGKFVMDAYLKQLPKEVKSLFKKHPAYFRTTRSINFSGHGFNYESVNTPETLPQDGNYTLVLNPELAKQIGRIKNRYENALKVYRDLKTEIENALLALATYARIEKEFPEAAKLLPTKTTMALTINLSDVRKKIA